MFKKLTRGFSSNLSKTLLVASLTTAALYPPSATANTDVYNAFGGKPGLTQLMDDFMVNLIADPRTQPFFDNDKQAFIKVMLVEQICELLGGPCKYVGRDMKSAHAHMKVNRAAFNALVEQLQFAMDKNEIPFSAQNKLLAKLAPMYRDIETTTGPAEPPKQ